MNFFVPLFVIAANLSLGAIVLFHDIKNNINRSFAFMTLCIAIWIYSSYSLFSSKHIYSILFWGKVIFVGPIFLASTFLYFSLIFPKPKDYSDKYKMYLLYLPAVFFTLILPSNLILKKVTINGGLVPIYGSLYPLFGIYIISYLCWAFVNLLRKYLASAGLEKMQLKYIFWGFLLSFVIAIVTNLILPSFKIAQLTTLGPLTSIIMIAVISYAIVKHRLMSIDILIQKGFIYTVVTLFVIAIYILIVMLSGFYLTNIQNNNPYLTILLAAFVISLTIQPFLNLLQNLTDKILFRKRYNYQHTLEELSRAITTIINTKNLSSLVAKTLISTMGIEKLSFLLHEKSKNKYSSIEIEKFDGDNAYKRIEINEQDVIVNALKKFKTIAVLEEIEADKRRHISNEEKSKKLDELCLAIRGIGAEVLVPLISKGELTGILILGKKLSGDMYSSDDLKLLLTLANQAAVGLENATLYDEILRIKNYTEEILHSLTSAVFSTDLSGNILAFNKMAKDLTGITFHSAIGKNITDLWGEKSSIAQVVGRALQGKTYKNFETTLVSKIKGTIPVNMNTVLLKNSSGQKTGILVIINDLSEIKHLEHKVRQSDKLAALGNMATGMAHEIKNPLSSMKVLTQLMSKKFGDLDYRKKFNDIMPREIARVDRIVESLLGFARTSSPKLEEVKILGVIEEALRYLNEQIKEHNIDVKQESDVIPTLIGDLQQLIQVFVNLFLNAIQAMPNGGTLKITARQNLKAKDETLKNIYIEISDTGHGIPKQYLPTLFDPFFTTKHGGTGLGLTIVHNIIEGHGGTISVESEVPKGTTFRILLPIKPE